MKRLSRARRVAAHSASRIRRLQFEQLENRSLLTVTISPIATDYVAPVGKTLYVPITGTDSGGAAISYQINSNTNSGFTSTVVTGGRTLQLNVAGTDNSGAAYTGTLTLRLFEDLAPATTARIIQLVNQGFYNNLTFHRVIDRFVVQGGDPNGDGSGGSGTRFNDEYNAALTFNSPGLLAMANSGNDSNDSQFFITAAPSDISVNTLTQYPQTLNFRYNVFGQLTSGFDTFNRLITANTNTTNNRPNNTLTITSASIITDTQNAVLRVDVAPGATGADTITVGATGGGGSNQVVQFNVSATADTSSDPPFLGTVPATVTTSINTSTTVQLTATNPQGRPLTYAVYDANNFGSAPANVTVQVNQTTGLVTLTPAAGFTGTINLIAGVRDNVVHSPQASAINDLGNFDTQRFSLVVNGATQLAVTTQPPTTTTAGTTFGLTVSARDASNNLAPLNTGSVTLSLANNPSSGTLGGTLTANFVNGVATFSGLSLNRVGTGYTIQATSSNLTSATTSGVAVTAGAATQLAYSVSPPTTTTAGNTFGVSVAAQDAQGNVVTTSSGTVTLALATGPTGATLGGTLTASLVNGVASFTGLSLTNAGSYTISASQNGLTSATSGTVTIGAAAVSQLVFTAAPSNVTINAPFSVTVAAQDQFGNATSTATGNVAIGIANGPGSATLGGTTSVALVNGVATVSNLTLDQLGTGYTLQATLSGLNSALSAGFNVTNVPTQLLVTTQPPANIAAGSQFSVAVTARDANGNDATGYNGTGTIALGQNPGSATLGGTLTATFVNGVATFSGLSLNSLGAGYTLVATSGTLTSATTSAFNVTATPTRLAISTQPPASVTAGTAFALTVQAQDAQGNVATGYTASVTIALAANPGTGTLGGTLTANFVAGVATFSNLTLNRVATGYTIQATSTGLTSATSSAVAVTPAAASALSITTQPPATTTTNANFGLVVTAVDSLGNTATSATGSVTVAFGANPGSANLGGTATVSLVNGVATFAGLNVNAAGTGYTLQATSSAGLTAATTSAFNVSVAASRIIFSTQPPANVTNGASFSVAITATDANGVTATGFTGSVTLAIGTNPASATLGGTLTANFTNGVATLTGLTLNRVANGYTLVATSSGLTNPTVTSSTLNVIAAPTRLVVSVPPPTSVVAGAGFAISIQAQDAQGNIATNYTGSVALTLSTNPGNSTLGGTTTVSFVNGQASFTGLTLNRVGTGYTLQAVSNGLTSVTSSAVAVTAASASALSVTTQPPASVTAGSPFGLVVSAVDAFGNPVTTATGQVALTISTNPATGTLSGTATATFVSGVATFSGLSINNVGTGYQLQATSGSLTSVTTSAFNITVAPTRLVVTTQPPSTVAAGGSFGLTVSAEDSNGTVATAYSGTATIGFGSNPGGSTLGGTLTVNIVNGVATFSGLTVTNPGTSYTLTTTSTGLTSATTSGFNVTAAPTRLVITSQPPTSVVAGATFGLAIAAADAQGNTVTNYNGTTTITLLANPGSATLGGTLTASLVNGVATLSGLTLNRVGTGYTLQATTTGLTAVTTNAVAVTVGAAAQLAVTSQPPSSVGTGVAFGLSVSVQDAQGNVNTGFSGNVALTLSTNPGTATLGGTTSVAVVNGIAAFSGLTLSAAGTGYIITAASSGLTAATTSAFNAVANTAPTGITVASGSRSSGIDGFVNTSTPTLNVTGQPGRTVTFQIGGQTVATATGDGAGNYSAAIPTGNLVVGANTITAISSDGNGGTATSSTFSLVYSPDIRSGFTTPGAINASQTVRINFNDHQAGYSHTLGYYVTDASGTVGGIAPGQPGYVRAALTDASTNAYFARTDGPGATRSITLNGGQRISFFLITNGSIADLLQSNPTNAQQNSSRPINVFFSTQAANPDGIAHVRAVGDPLSGVVQYSWEDMFGGGDRDYNDSVITFSFSGATRPEAIRTPGSNSANNIAFAASLINTAGAIRSEVGVYVVDNATGAVGGVAPGAAGYAQAVLNSAQRFTLFSPGANGGSQTVNLPQNSLIGFYVIDGGTRSQLLSSNPNNRTGQSPIALFSFQAGNVDGLTHFRSYGPELRAISTSLDTIHVLDRTNGSLSDFDSFAISYQFNTL